VVKMRVRRIDLSENDVVNIDSEEITLSNQCSLPYKRRETVEHLVLKNSLARYFLSNGYDVLFEERISLGICDVFAWSRTEEIVGECGQCYHLSSKLLANLPYISAFYWLTFKRTLLKFTKGVNFEWFLDSLSKIRDENNTIIRFAIMGDIFT